MTAPPAKVLLDLSEDEDVLTERTGQGDVDIADLLNAVRSCSGLDKTAAVTAMDNLVCRFVCRFNHAPAKVSLIASIADVVDTWGSTAGNWPLRMHLTGLMLELLPRHATVEPPSPLAGQLAAMLQDAVTGVGEKGWMAYMNIVRMLDILLHRDDPELAVAVLRRHGIPALVAKALWHALERQEADAKQAAQEKGTADLIYDFTRPHITDIGMCAGVLIALVQPDDFSDTTNGIQVKLAQPAALDSALALLELATTACRALPFANADFGANLESSIALVSALLRVSTWHEGCDASLGKSNSLKSSPSWVAGVIKDGLLRNLGHPSWLKDMTTYLSLLGNVGLASDPNTMRVTVVACFQGIKLEELLQHNERAQHVDVTLAPSLGDNSMSDAVAAEGPSASCDALLAPYVFSCVITWQNSDRLQPYPPSAVDPGADSSRQSELVELAIFEGWLGLVTAGELQCDIVPVIMRWLVSEEGSGEPLDTKTTKLWECAGQLATCHESWDAMRAAGTLSRALGVLYVASKMPDRGQAYSAALTFISRVTADPRAMEDGDAPIGFSWNAASSLGWEELFAAEPGEAGANMGKEDTGTLLMGCFGSSSELLINALYPLVHPEDWKDASSLVQARFATDSSLQAASRLLEVSATAASNVCLAEGVADVRSNLYASVALLTCLLAGYKRHGCNSAVPPHRLADAHRESVELVVTAMHQNANVSVGSETWEMHLQCGCRFLAELVAAYDSLISGIGGPEDNARRLAKVYTAGTCRRLLEPDAQALLEYWLREFESQAAEAEAEAAAATLLREEEEEEAVCKAAKRKKQAKRKQKKGKQREVNSMVAAARSLAPTSEDVAIKGLFSPAAEVRQLPIAPASAALQSTEAACPVAAQGDVPAPQAAPSELRHSRLTAEEMECPITQVVMSDPVIAADGHTYERSAIEEWYSRHDTSPMTNDVVESKLLISNMLMRRLIASYRAQQHAL
ncbi:hypothetical protein WJX72_006490 [[Myrmecia] bisecta]|uniref:U-box domain-containing protein n=1 Tax=[Myrmecia] bisecta TaxID=41462 RepID=A0AAW1R6F1_9CHLO